MTQNKWLVVGAMGLALSLCFICVAVLALALVIIPSLQSNQDVAKNETITPPRPTAGSTPSSVLSPSPSTWKLIPVVIDAAQTNDGWINYQVVLALENQSSQSAHPVLDLGFSSVETQEGYTYELQYSQAPNYLNLPLIPPQFRIRNFPGQAWTEFIIKFQVAQNTHPLRIKFSKYGNIDLVQQSPIFPTSQPKTAFRDVTGTFIEVPDKGRVTLGKVYRRDSAGFPTHAIIDVEVENLNKGYQTTLTADCVMFDGIGSVRQVSNGTRAFILGPGQKRQTSFDYSLDDIWDFDTRIQDEKKTQNALTNAKLVCSGDFKAMFNLDF